MPEAGTLETAMSDIRSQSAHLAAERGPLTAAQLATVLPGMAPELLSLLAAACQ